MVKDVAWKKPSNQVLLRPPLSSLIVCVFVLNDLARTSSGIPIVKRVEGTDMVPALALPKAEIAKASKATSVLSCPPTRNCSIAIDTPDPFSVGNSAATTFVTFTTVCPVKLLFPTSQNPVKVKKLLVKLSVVCPVETRKSVRMSGSEA
ncbi:hypothetical protein SUGI_1026710 [Cryptomeria japonica]|nr:hypothetical protein SUGI_1026710 [Cryptomeria japonica]